MPANPVVREPAIEVPRESFAGAGAGAGRLAGAADVVNADRTAFGLIGVEEAGGGPSAQDPSELPAEVEGVLDGSVHAGAASRGHAVGGVTDEEAAPLTVPFGDLRREREAPQPLDARPEFTDAGSTGDQINELSLAKAGEPRLASGPFS